MLVTHYLDLSKPIELTEEELKQLEEAKKQPITYDEDCPPLTEEQMKDYFRELLKKKGYVKKEDALAGVTE